MWATGDTSGVRRAYPAIALAAALLAITVVAPRSGSGRAAAAPVTAITQIAVSPSTPSRAIPRGFLGLSVEYATVGRYAADAHGTDPLFERLIGDLAPGQSPVLRVGGDSTDHTWWPVRRMRRPAGVTYDLSRRWLRQTAALARRLSLKLILGIDLEANSRRLAAAEARALVGGIGRRRISALEIGNEPELYASFSWYRDARGRAIPGRRAGYTPDAFAAQFSGYSRALPHVPVAGPSSGSVLWGLDLPRFIGSVPRLDLITVHSYPLKSCGSKPGDPGYPAIPQLLSDSASIGLADSVADDVSDARASGLPIRVDEMNSVSCGGARGVSDTFAASLWAIKTTFAMAAVGVDGINIHSRPGTTDKLFGISDGARGWRATVEPEYYGLLVFANAAPAGSRLLRIPQPSDTALRIWATRDRAGTVRVVLVNTGANARTATISLPGAVDPASLELLTAPSLRAGQGIAWAGQSYGRRTATARLAGVPRQQTVVPAGGVYRVKVPGPSAALLTVTGT